MGSCHITLMSADNLSKIKKISYEILNKFKDVEGLNEVITGI